MSERNGNIWVGFCICNNSRVQIFRIDEWAGQKALAKNDLQEVTMNWNRFVIHFVLDFVSITFGNLICNNKRVFTPLLDLPTRIIEVSDTFWNSTIALAFTKNPRIFCKCKCHFWVWRMVDSLFYSSRKVQERCENSCELQNKLPKALWFSEAKYERNELTQWLSSNLS